MRLKRSLIVLQQFLINLLMEVRFRIKKLFGKDEKIFIIGRNKTGTTSIEKCLKNMGYRIGNQITGELFIDDYIAGNFDNILDFCDSAEVFQDVPFSWPNTYKHLYEKYPDAKYILLERKDSETWFNSVVNFHRKIINNGDKVTVEDLKNFTYRRKGFLWQSQQHIFGIDESNVYDKDTYISNYESHNEEVKKFFNNKKNFLSIKLSDKDVTVRLASFLNKELDDVVIPHLNKSK